MLPEILSIENEFSKLIPDVGFDSYMQVDEHLRSSEPLPEEIDNELDNGQRKLKCRGR